MQETGAVSEAAVKYIENLGENGLPALTDKFTGAEAAGLVRSKLVLQWVLAVSSSSLLLRCPHLRFWYLSHRCS